MHARESFWLFKLGPFQVMEVEPFPPVLIWILMEEICVNVGCMLIMGIRERLRACLCTCAGGMTS